MQDCYEEHFIHEFFYHAPNRQSVVSKLPANLQSKWRDQVLKRKKREDGVICFADLAEFVDCALE